MVIERFSPGETEVEMFGLTFDLDTRMLEEEFGTTRSKVYSEIEKKLLDEGFTHIQYSVYFYEKPKSAMEFGFLVRKTFSSFRYARAIRDLQGFEVKNRSAMTDEIAEAHEDAVGLKRPLWPPA